MEKKKVAAVYYPDRPPERVVPNNGKDFKLKEVQELVGGMVECFTNEDGTMLLFNEEGLLLDLPVNHYASMRFQMHLVGPVVVVPDGMFL